RWSISGAGKAATKKDDATSPVSLLPVSDAPVGIFDSGVGGLSVLREIHALLPAESLYYVADSANAPWGDKPPEFVRDRGLEISRFLLEQGVKAVVIGSTTGAGGPPRGVGAPSLAPVTRA